MKILILGAGAVASVASKFLAKEKSISEIVCASNNLKLGKEFIDTKNSKISLAKVDASKTSQIAKLAKDSDLIINASLPYFNDAAMEAALKVNSNYQDLCSYLKDFKTAEQLRFNKRFQKARLSGIINTGISPGITNLLAAEIADILDSISEINVIELEDQKSSKFVFSWSPNVVLDTISAPPLAYKNNKFQLLDRFGSAEKYRFPEPHGKKYIFNAYGDEISTIPIYIKTKKATLKAGGSELDFSMMLYNLGLLSNKSIKVNDKKVVPLQVLSKIAPKMPTPKEMSKMVEDGTIENASYLSIVEGLGTQSGRKLKVKMSVIYPNLKEIFKKIKGATYISYPTGLAVSAFSKIIPKIEESGVFPPEALSQELRKEVLIDLENKGILVDKQFSKP